MGKWDRETLLEEKKTELMEGILKEAAKSGQERRAALLAQQREETEELESTHQQFIQNLTDQFKRQVMRMRK